MFIVNYRDGRTLTEGMQHARGALTWDDIPDGIVNLQLTYPVKLQFRDRDGNLVKEAAPTLSIGRYDRYFFYNEAVAIAAVQGGDRHASQGQLVAKVIAGIDDERHLVVETRFDAWGNCEVRRYSLESLQKRIAAGQFDPASIRLAAR